MAFKEIKGGKHGETVYLGNDTKRGQVKQFEGFPVACHSFTKEGKRGEKSVYNFVGFVTEDAADAEPVSLLCPGQLWHTLTEETEGKRIVRDTLIGQLCRVTYLGKEKVEGFKAPLHQCKVEVDDAKELKHYQPLPI